MSNAILIQSPISDFLAEFLFKFDWYVQLNGRNPTVEQLSRIGLRGTVIRYRDFRLFVNPNDHLPPHFHVRSNGEEAAFSIKTGLRMPGHTGLKDRDNIIYTVWEIGRLELANCWNETRPSDCSYKLFEIPPEWGNGPTEHQQKQALRNLHRRARASRQ